MELNISLSNFSWIDLREILGVNFLSIYKQLYTQECNAELYCAYSFSLYFIGYRKLSKKTAHN